MKKFVIALSLLLMACSESSNDQIEFKNPVFNQPLEHLGKTSIYIHLTPTSTERWESVNDTSFFYKGKCDLIENEQDRITLKCNGKWDDGLEWKQYFTYIILKVSILDCLRIQSYEYDTLEDLQNHIYTQIRYCVTQPEETLPRNN
jgi:hypothetical protein